MRFGVLIAVSMKVTFLGHLSPFSLVHNYQSFQGIFCLHVCPKDGNKRFIQNVGSYIYKRMVSDCQTLLPSLLSNLLSFSVV